MHIKIEKCQHEQQQDGEGGEVDGDGEENRSEQKRMQNACKTEAIAGCSWCRCASCPLLLRSLITSKSAMGHSGHVDMQTTWLRGCTCCLLPSACCIEHRQQSNFSFKTVCTD